MLRICYHNFLKRKEGKREKKTAAPLKMEITAQMVCSEGRTQTPQAKSRGRDPLPARTSLELPAAAAHTLEDLPQHNKGLVTPSSGPPSGTDSPAKRSPLP